MEKTLKNADIDALYRALSELANSDMNFPVELGFRIMQNIRELEKHANLFISERNKIIGQYAKDGQTVNQKDDPEKFAECSDKIKQLGELEVSVTIAEVDIEKIRNMELPMKYMFALETMTTTEKG